MASEKPTIALKKYAVGLFLTIVFGPLGTIYAGCLFGGFIHSLWISGHILLIPALADDLISNPDGRISIHVLWYFADWMLSIIGSAVAIHGYNDRKVKEYREFERAYR